jgi:2-dehydro-3-deoxyphosphooctonate aldolase (KDO 8-P synthase)
MKAITARLGISYVFKASFDKANRTSLTSFRGPGAEKGLRILGRLREEIGVPVVSDIHEPAQAEMAADYLDILQIPAFLCRQTDLLVAAARTGKVVNVKKGQFVSPWDMEYAVNKLRGAGSERILLTERGSSFGYNNLVVDMRSLPVMRSFGYPVIYDATHSVQLPGGAGGSSGGQREFIPALSRAAMAVGIDGLFIEVHPDPSKALCDGPNSLPLAEVESLLKQLLAVRQAVAGIIDA